MNDTTLQINLSPGDVAYAPLTVPALLAGHPHVTERLLVVDLCKPQPTRIVDPARRFPEPAYSERVARIAAFADQLLASGQVDRVVTLRPGDALFPVLSRTYLRSWITETHDYGGCALMSYLAAFELCRTRWLLHYDADMLLYQAPGYDWAAPARAVLAARPALVAATPRTCPPPENDGLPSLDEGLPHEQIAEGWTAAWFSTRCGLFDRNRLRSYLPLVSGRLWWDSLLRKLTGRGYPRSPEVLLGHRLGRAGARRLCLRSREAWLIHPADKGPEFLSLLPQILASVRAGSAPAGQHGRNDLQLSAWRDALAADGSPRSADAG